MKISCLQEDLNRGLSVVKRALPTKTTMSVLQSVLINANAGKLRLTATDLALTIIYDLPAVVETSGTCALLANTFSEFVSKLPQDRIDITSDTKLHIKCHRYSSNISLINADDFPALQTPEFSTRIKIKSSVLFQALKQVEFAMLNNTAKPQLNGVCLEILDNTLWLAAADTTMMSTSKIVLLSQFPNTKIIIPAKTVGELTKILTNEDKEVFIELSQTQIRIIFDNVIIQSMLISGNYPNFRDLILQTHETQVILNTKEFLESLKLAGVFSEKKGVIMQIEQNKVSIFSGFEETGDNECSIDAVVTGPGLGIAFNGESMIEAITTISQDKIALYFQDAHKPIVVKIVGNDTFLYVLAPMYKPNISSAVSDV